MKPEFDAQPFDVCVEGAGVGVITMRPDRTEKFVPLADLVGMLAKVTEEFALGTNYNANESM